MLLNYFKLGIRVLLRNKLYTFISLFGISFTLMVLMLLTAYIDSSVGKNKPITQRDRIMLIDQIRLTGWERRTEIQVDSSLVDGKMQYDTTETLVPVVGENESQSSSSLGLNFSNQYLKDLELASEISFFNGYKIIDVFLNGKKKRLRSCLADVNYWNIFDFEFIEGQPFTQADVEGQKRKIVVKESIAKELFGNIPSYLKQEMQFKGMSYEVCGVIKDIQTGIDKVNQDIYMPYTLSSDSELNSFAFFGEMTAAFLLKPGVTAAQFNQRMRQIEKQVDLSKEARFDIIEILEANLMEKFASRIMRRSTDNYKYLVRIIALAVFLFILIPTLNLINISITRIMERSSEIGVRKAFGATTKHLFQQFIFENIILCVLGGIIGLMLAYVAVYLLNSSEILGRLQLKMNINVFLWSMLITLTFGIISGILPAWKMSRSEIAHSLKNNSL